VHPLPGLPPFLFLKASIPIMSDVTTNHPASEPQPSRSTGPRTEAGKTISSQNARKHDLCSKTLRLSAEERADYNEMRARYGRDLQPADDIEETLIDEICFNYWRLQQAREAELGIIDKHSTELGLISLYIRYRTGYERAFYKALDQLQKRQRDRRKQGSSPEQLPVAPVPLAPVCSIEPETDPVRSAEPSQSQELQEQIDDHVLENRVRGELCLPPLPFPKELRQKVEDFVSQNPGRVADGLRQALKLAA
jgi:hypothetical protein